MVVTGPFMVKETVEQPKSLIISVMLLNMQKVLQRIREASLLFKVETVVFNPRIVTATILVPLVIRNTNHIPV